MDGSATNDGAAAGRSTKFSKGHFNGHNLSSTFLSQKRIICASVGPHTDKRETYS